jgi:hypothetical protein
MRLKLERRALAGLIPYAHNTKQHPPEQIAAIARSIRRFGFNDPIGIKPDGTIIEGQGRWLAAQECGLTEVPVLVVDGLTDRQYDLYRIAHNKHALTTSFKMDVLAATLRELTGGVEGDINLSDLGFSDTEVLNLFASTDGDGARFQSRRGATPLSYDVVFDGPDEQKTFNRFMKAITAHYQARSKGEALSRFITNSGVLTGAPQPVLKAVTHYEAGSIEEEAND